MDVEISEALLAGVKAHREGNFRRADQYYTAILNAQPNHSDANHNMGVLAINVGQAEHSLKYFVNAIVSDDSVFQFWASLFDALVQLHQTKEFVFIENQTKALLAAQQTSVKEDIILENLKIYVNSKIESLILVGLDDDALAFVNQVDVEMSTDAEFNALRAHIALNNDDYKGSSRYLELAKNCNEKCAKYGWVLARTKLRAGFLKEAKDICRLYVDLYPNDEEGKILSANCLLVDGKISSALAMLESVDKSSKFSTDALSLRGLCLVKKNQHQMAIKSLHEAFLKCNTRRSIWEILLSLAIQLKSYDIADEVLGVALKYDPKNHVYLRYLAKLKILKNNFSGVVDVLKQIPENEHSTQDLSDIGFSLTKLGKYDIALNVYGKLAVQTPEDPWVHYYLGYVNGKLNRTNESICSYKYAIKLNPQFVDALSNLANQYLQLKIYRKALIYYEKVVELDMDKSLHRHNLASAYQQAGEFQKALNIYSELQKSDPTNDSLLRDYSLALIDSDQLSEARQVLKKAIKINPYFLDAYWTLSTITNYKDDKDLIDNLLSLTEFDTCKDNPSLYFSLFCAFRDTESYDKAFDMIIKANKLKYQTIPGSLEYDRQLFEEVKKIDYQGIQQLNIQKQEKFTPIFIVGMPRSGTTLLEQILSNHTVIDGAGELPYIDKCCSAFLHSDVSTDAMFKARHKYLSSIAHHHVNGLFIIDKMPQNFFFVGLIAKIFPEAKILHIYRDAKAVFWSNFTTNFGNNGLKYAYNIKHLEQYLNMYNKLMEYWTKKFPNLIFHQKYEDLVEAPRDSVYKLLKFLDLDWEEACIQPHLNKRIVRTASKQQVKDKISTSNNLKWEKYAEFLDRTFPGLNNLENFIVPDHRAT